MNTKLIAAACGAFLTVAVLAGCSTPSGGARQVPGADDGGGSSSATSSTHNAADVAFAMNMVMHHQQAIEMSDMLLAKQGVDPRVADLASKIKDAQGPEIDTMNSWLSGWGQSSDMSGMHHGDGMMSQADMTALQNATGAEAGSLFLTQMVEHHEGAIDMAKAEVQNGRNPDAVALAHRIVTDQTAEIATMQSMLAGG